MTQACPQGIRPHSEGPALDVSTSAVTILMFLILLSLNLCLVK